MVASLYIEHFGQDFEKIVMHDLQDDDEWEFFSEVSAIYVCSARKIMSVAEAAKRATIAIVYKENDRSGYVIVRNVRVHEGKDDEALALCEQAC